ncbi:uncharacterized protein PV07_12396 [Cladophialophora immunda]|uniref:Uncharacterized protein n=1 Tax=Cladophialophora immunda TaxID=569365 RepID=A0A0D2BU27_9EURO|nr:uncharacterized protein PV07_12396 [Cladophialophora immunda]KIW22518.1 hypothetical protein PV07_12396 [Cladophialophora immunda]
MLSVLACWRKASIHRSDPLGWGWSGGGERRALATVVTATTCLLSTVSCMQLPNLRSKQTKKDTMGKILSVEWKEKIGGQKAQCEAIRAQAGWLAGQRAARRFPEVESRIVACNCTRW